MSISQYSFTCCLSSEAMQIDLSSSYRKQTKTHFIKEFGILVKVRMFVLKAETNSWNWCQQHICDFPPNFCEGNINVRCPIPVAFYTVQKCSAIAPWQSSVLFVFIKVHAKDTKLLQSNTRTLQLQKCNCTQYLCKRWRMHLSAASMGKKRKFRLRTAG